MCYQCETKRIQKKRLQETGKQATRELNHQLRKVRCRGITKMENDTNNTSMCHKQNEAKKKSLGKLYRFYTTAIVSIKII